MRGRPSLEKRRKETARAERKRNKAAKRAERKSVRSDEEGTSIDNVDPDIAGIVPGPQPLPFGLERSDRNEGGSSSAC